MTAWSMAGDPWCPVHMHLLCRCTPYTKTFFDQRSYPSPLSVTPPPPPLADNRKRRRARTALARRVGR